MGVYPSCRAIYLRGAGRYPDLISIRPGYRVGPVTYGPVDRCLASLVRRVIGGLSVEGERLPNRLGLNG